MSNLPHDNAHTHVSGQSEYVDDRPAMTNELFVEVVYSPHAHATIKKINTKKALGVSGVQAIYTSKDFPHNKWGTIFKDQPLLADKKVNFAGEAIAIVAADSRQAAIEARNLVEVDYQVLPAILSIHDAKIKKAWIADERKIVRGEVDANLKQAPHTISGNIIIHGADHFYLESQVSIVYPKEDGQLEVHTSSQHPTETQHVIAHSLGLKASDVTCIVKRMGGGFGGKESQAAPFAAYAALVAHTLKRPARITLTKDDDMIMTGKRNPFENLYKVGFDNDGRILALDAKLYSDSGAYADLSTSIMERAMLHIDNAYFIPHLRVTGQVCKTNIHPHTAFRGFGGPKGVATIEKIIEQIAHHLNKDSLEIRKLNVYTDDDQRNITHYGQVVNNNCLPKLFSQLEVESKYHQRQKDIAINNQQVLDGKSHILKGLSLTPVKFGISFTTRFLNQANALVIIHRDGTLQVATGATEMGQGVNARIAELISREFGIERSFVRMMPTSTDKNANTSPTAASSGTDLNGAAALLAVRKLKAKLSGLCVQLLKTHKDKWASLTAGLGTEEEMEVADIDDTNDANENVDWNLGTSDYHGIAFKNGFVFHQDQPTNKIAFADVVNEAYLNRLSLTEYAHYKFPNLSFNKLSGRGDAFLYFTQGVAASEVSVDTITGEVKAQRVDILMDLGKSINEGLDIGQVTGAFIQGMGWVTTEKLFYNKGYLVSHSPSTYKIPNIQDTPREFNVKLFDNPNNLVNVRATKAAGEPPLLLAISMWTAIQNAIKVLPDYKCAYPNIELPATNEEVLRAIYPNRFTRKT